ncbi:unnamed protein product [Adineta ricciae]|uniref:Uncharacterized protein n=1 Tax=Adineta ricciae TaxID=249248 RepID=A0A813QNY8_ADIRI|nr:unnamed protein product [Adineta ricciae]CAF0979883.1 unnamed protein product [Adineta ricciae]
MLTTATTTSPNRMMNYGSTDTISHLVLRHPRAHVIQSHGDGFGSYVERLLNVAHETHQAFPHLIHTLEDLINYFREELERTYSSYQFSIIAGHSFDHDQIYANPSALIEHSGIKILIVSTIGCSYKCVTTTSNDQADYHKSLSW